MCVKMFQLWRTYLTFASSQGVCLLKQCPVDMLLHECRYGWPFCVERSYNSCVARRIAKPYGDIPQPTFVANPANRRTFGIFQILGFAPVKKRHQVAIGQTMARQKIGFARKLRVFIPGTDCLAIVATEYPVAYGLAEFERNCAFVFDGEVGNTAACVQLIGLGKGIGRADF